MIVPLVLILAIGSAISWHFSSDVLVPDHSGWPADVEVVAVGPGEVTLSRSEETLRPGIYGLDWQAGHARVGAIARTGPETVTRRLAGVRGYLEAGQEVAIDSEVHSGDPSRSLGLPH